MCGIVGYVGDQQALDIVIRGLRRLEYRGYDSAGVALVHSVDGRGEIATEKKAGKLANLDKALAETPLPESTIGIGHTRWATHGPPNDRNAHPHLGQKRRVAVVHNGIIENFAQLRHELERKGHDLLSDTDTEVAAHLLELELADGADLTTAMQRLCRRLEGAFTLVAVDAHDPTAGWWPPAATPRSWSVSVRARTSSPPTWRRSSSTRVRHSSSVRTRS